MQNKLFVGGALLVLAISSVGAADASTSSQGMQYDQNKSVDPGDYYQSNELSIDGFGTASVGKYTIENFSNSRIRHNTRLGVGGGVSYFITRNIGFGADAYSENTTGTFIDNASINMIVRFPIGQSGFAPYIFAGPGRQFDLAKVWLVQAGGGAEYRFTQHLGIFLDGRWALPEKTKYYGVARLGMRFVF